jgi:hypothetical protein
VDHPELSFRLRAVPSAAFVDLIRAAGEPLDAGQLKERLQAMGVDRDTAEKTWRRAQPGVRRHAYVVYDAAGGGTYRWSDSTVPTPAPRLNPVQAFDRLLRGRLAAAARTELAGTVSAALRERDELEARVRQTYQDERAGRAAHDRQVRVDAARALAEMAMEVEELTAAGSPSGVLVERIRALAKAFDLEPIGRAGDAITFDAARHTPIGPTPLDGAPVVVIRPGYTWRSGDHAVLLGKAQVARS